MVIAGVAKRLFKVPIVLSATLGKPLSGGAKEFSEPFQCLLFPTIPCAEIARMFSVITWYQESRHDFLHLIVFISALCIFGGVLLGMFLQKVSPEHLIWTLSSKETAKAVVPV